MLRRVLCPSLCWLCLHVAPPLPPRPSVAPLCHAPLAATPLFPRPSPHALPLPSPRLLCSPRPAVNPGPEFAKECAAALSRVRGPRLPLLHVLASPPARRRASVCPFKVRVLRMQVCVASFSRPIPRDSKDFYWDLLRHLFTLRFAHSRNNLRPPSPSCVGCGGNLLALHLSRRRSSRLG